MWKIPSLHRNGKDRSKVLIIIKSCYKWSLFLKVLGYDFKVDEALISTKRSIWGFFFLPPLFIFRLVVFMSESSLRATNYTCLLLEESGKKITICLALLIIMQSFIAKHDHLVNLLLARLHFWLKFIIGIEQVWRNIILRCFYFWFLLISLKQIYKENT